MLKISNKGQELFSCRHLKLTFQFNIDKSRCNVWQQQNLQKFLSMLLHFLRVQLCAEVQELHLSLTWMEAAKVRTKRTYFFGWGTILYLLLELDASFLQLPLKIIYFEKLMLAKTNTTSMKTGESIQQILRWAFIIKTNRPCQTLAEFGGLARLWEHQFF